jgi:hypothetical protein
MFEQFIKELEYLKNVSPLTIKSYRQVYGRYCKFSGENDILPTRTPINQFVIRLSHAQRKQKPVPWLSNSRFRYLADSLSNFNATCTHDNTTCFFFRAQYLSSYPSLFPRKPITANINSTIAKATSKFSSLQAFLTLTASNSNSCFWSRKLSSHQNLRR